MSADRKHIPVLAREVRSWLASDDREVLIVDSTLGEGGHSALLLSDNPRARVTGVDTDPVMLERARTLLGDDAGRVEFVNCWFDDFWAGYTGPAPDRILFDLGVSSYHFGDSGRGFSFTVDEPLDMRLSGRGPNAAELLETIQESELADLLYELGGERYSRRIARAICAALPVTTSAELAEIVRSAVPVAYRRGKIHPATRTFQALRIAVNSELDRIKRALSAAIACLTPNGGRLAVISFHSLEDRIVKWTFRRAAGMHIPKGSAGDDSTVVGNPPTIESGAESGIEVRILTRKPVVPSASEAHENPASRSAKLRVLEKVSGENGQ